MVISEEINYIKGLNIGNELVAKKLVRSIGDIGCSGLTFDYDAFIPGKTYQVHSITRRDFQQVAYVMDEDGTLHLATTEIFDLK